MMSEDDDTTSNAVNQDYAKNLPGLKPSKIFVAKSRARQRFLRVWEQTHDHNGKENQRMAFGFVEPHTGFLYKVATWKKPETNFPRGSIYNVPAYTSGIYEYNTRYTGPVIKPGYTGGHEGWRGSDAP